jgi:type VI secretion system protein VasI
MGDIMRVTILALALALPCDGALAQQSTCGTVEDSIERLACYDKESGRTPKIETTNDPKSDWVVRTQVSKLTDQKGVYLSLESKDRVSCRFNQGSKAMLMIRCHENTTSIYLSSECHMTSSEYNDYGDVTYRVDDKPSVKAKFEESTDNKSLGAWEGGKAIPIIKRLMSGSNLVMQFTPYNESPKITEFNIAGLDQVIGPLREQCKW